MKDLMELTVLMPANAVKYYTDLQLELLDTRDTAASTERSSDDEDDKIMDYRI